jgi:hypothetical protein
MSITLDGTTGIVAPAIDVATPITVSDGGTGLSALGTANQVLAVNAGATALEFQTVAGGVTSLNGQTGAITNTDYGAIGSYVVAGVNNFASNTEFLPDTTTAGNTLVRTTSNVNWSFLNAQSSGTIESGTSTSLGFSGTWRRLTRTRNSSSSATIGLFVRIS